MSADKPRNQSWRWFVVACLIVIGAAWLIGRNPSTERPVASASPTACTPSPCVSTEDGWTARVTGVTRGVTSPNEFEHPGTGNQFVRIGVEFTNSGQSEFHVSESDFVLQDPNGVKRPSSSIAGVACGWSSVNLAKGGGHFGPQYLCFEAGGDPKGKLLLVWTPQLFGKDYVVELS